MGKMVSMDDVEDLIALADETGHYADWTFEFELAQMKYKDKVAEIRGKEVTEFDVPLRLIDFDVGMRILITERWGYLYVHPGVDEGDELEIVDLIRDGRRYDRILAKKVDGDDRVLFEFMVFDQDKFKIVG